ncbi:MAG: nucleotidyltransferase domain-containing protein [Candidatus Asgardarchaeia archaeon]
MIIKIIKVEKVDEHLLDEVVRRILKVINPVKIILFGSWAYGRPKKGSDLDILVIMDDDIRSRRRVAAEVYGALCGIMIPKDVVVATLRDLEEWKNVPNAFITAIVKKGRVIYERKGRPREAMDEESGE